MQLIICLLLVVSLAIATPGKPNPVCGGNVCYPVLVGPLVKDIATDFCLYYLKYPISTTKTVKSTATVTGSCTIPKSTVKVTATNQVTVPTTTTTTELVGGAVVTETATVTVTAMMKKREPKPHWSPPKNSGDQYKPPPLAPFDPKIVSAACSCVVAPTTTTITTTVKATSTAKNSCTQEVTKTTIQTVTATITSTATVTTTVVDAPTTVTVTTTTTVATPVPTCVYPLNDQRGVRGTMKPGTDTSYSFFQPSSPNAEDCYNTVKNRVIPPGPFNPTCPCPANLQSYIFKSDANPGSPDGPGACYGYNERSCDTLLINPLGDSYGGDTSLPY